MCVICVNEYGTYDECKTSSHAYDGKRAHMNAHACSLKEQQSVIKPVTALREVQQQQAAVVLDES